MNQYKDWIDEAEDLHRDMCYLYEQGRLVEKELGEILLQHIRAQDCPFCHKSKCIDVSWGHDDWYISCGYCRVCTPKAKTLRGALRYWYVLKELHKFITAGETEINGEEKESGE